MTTKPHYLLQFFTWEHLPTHLQAVSKPFGELALRVCIELPDNAERTTALRKLLESKDCAVRALLFKRPINIGDVVQLKSGGPDMLVIEKVGETCVCRWDGGEGQNHDFHEETLTRLERTTP